MNLCPTCGNEFKLDGLEEPDELKHAFALCMECGQVLVVDAGPVLRFPTKAEMEFADESGMLDVMRLVRVHRQMVKAARKARYEAVSRHLRN